MALAVGATHPAKQWDPSRFREVATGLVGVGMGVGCASPGVATNRLPCALSAVAECSFETTSCFFGSQAAVVTLASWERASISASKRMRSSPYATLSSAEADVSGGFTVSLPPSAFTRRPFTSARASTKSQSVQ